MFNKVVKLTAGVLVGALLISGVPAQALASSASNDTNYITGSTYSSFSAGAHSAINETVVLENTESDILYAGVSNTDAPVVATAVWNNPYAKIAIANVDGYVNIRAAADSEAEALGKLYANGSATVLETLDGWYKIQSGNVTGYVSADFLIVGDPETCEGALTKVGTVTATTLKLRKTASTSAGVYAVMEQGARVQVVGSSEGWYKVVYGSNTGYVASDYLSVETSYLYAESKAEEAARLESEAEEKRKAEEEEERRRQEEEERRQEEEEEDDYVEPSEPDDDDDYNPPSGGDGQAVADFAVQFVGNPYKWGGTSLTNGADCSGFVQSVYKHFGVSLPRTSSQQRYCGYGVSASEVQPGDIICYSGHVAIYIGGGKIVHASNKKDGIKISNNWQYQKVLAIRRIF